MTGEVCPYCRTLISDAEQVTACEGCGTRHHAECYTENGGCTIFGCSCVPPEEPKLTLSTPELASVAHSTSMASTTQTAVAPPPPPPGSVPQTPSREVRPTYSPAVPSMLNLFPPEPVPVQTYHEPEPVPAGEPKSRTTYIVLGALLGTLGIHNFYAGYNSKAIAQLAITVVTFGFASPMSWMWAIIDICTIDRDKRGIQFES